MGGLEHQSYWTVKLRKNWPWSAGFNDWMNAECSESFILEVENRIPNNSTVEYPITAPEKLNFFRIFFRGWNRRPFGFVDVHSACCG